MSEVKRYDFEYVDDLGNGFSASPRLEVDGEYVEFTELVALRQQLADVSNERDEALKQTVLLDHKARKASRQRATLKLKLNASDALLREMRHEDYTRLRDIADMHNRVDAHLAQSAPATNPSTTRDLPDGPLTDEGTKAPATDEQGAE